jgi:hypothetical protein
MITVRMTPDRANDAAVPANGLESAQARIAFLHVAGGENLLLLPTSDAVGGGCRGLTTSVAGARGPAAVARPVRSRLLGR